LLIFSLVSSLSAAAFVTGNNLVFAKKNGGSGSSGGGSSDKGGGGSGGSGDNGGGGGTTTTEGTDNKNNADTGTTNTSPPPSTDESTPPPPPKDQKTCPDGSTPDESGNCPSPATNQKTCPDGSTPDESGNCPTTTQQNTAPQTLAQQTCPGGAAPDATTGNCPASTNTPPPCPGGAARDANLLCPTSTTIPTPVQVPALPGGKCPPGYHLPADISSRYAPVLKCDKDEPTTTTPARAVFHINQDGTVSVSANQDGSCRSGTEHIPGDNPNLCRVAATEANQDGSCPPNNSHIPGADAKQCFVDTALQTANAGTGATTTPTSIPKGAVLKPKDGSCPRFVNEQTPSHPDASGSLCFSNFIPIAPGDKCPSGYVKYSKASSDDCFIHVTPTNTDGSCDFSYKHITASSSCIIDDDSSFGLQIAELPGGHCPTGYDHISTQCFGHLNVIGGSTTGTGGGFIQMFPTKPDGSIGTSGPVVVYVPANKDGSCNPGDDPASGGSCRHKVQSTGNTAGSTGTTGGTTTPTTPTGNTGGTTTTTTTTTGNPTTTTTTPPTSTTTTTNVIRGGGGSSGGGGGTTAAATPSQGANSFLTYVNSINKITIKYPSTWTKTELVGNPSIPVMFNAPTIATTAGAAKTSFVISITPSASNLVSFTQQQINGLTQSNTIKYTITDTNAKVLTAPTGITAFREVSYYAVKNNNVPLKGAAIFFVNGGTGYSLLYLAKQTEYTQSLPMVQQMVNSFQIGTSSGPVQNVAASNSQR
jgi:hypothetical protein